MLRDIYEKFFFFENFRKINKIKLIINKEMDRNKSNNIVLTNKTNQLSNYMLQMEVFEPHMVQHT